VRTAVTPREKGRGETVTEEASQPRATRDHVAVALEIVSNEDPAHCLQVLSMLLGHMPGFVYLLNRDLRFTASIGAGLAYLDLVDNQLVGVEVLDMWGTRDPNYEPHLCHRRALAGEPQTYQDFCLGRSLEYQLGPLRGADGSIVGVIGVGFDVTEREQAKQRQAQLTEQLRQAQKLEDIGRLAGGVAHDFNNLLTAMMGHLTLAEEQCQADSPIRDHISACNRAVDSAATLTRQLLAFGRKQVISPRPINLTTLIHTVEGMLRRLIGESIHMHTAFDAELWNVKADPGQLEQVLVNLVVNARDAIEDHGRIEIRTANLAAADCGPELPSSLSPADYVMLSVRDTGRGMSDVVRSKLFEPFFTTKERGEGTGLGLATVYGAAQQNGGAVAVESKLGAGSTFTIFLPRHVGVEEEHYASPPPVEKVAAGGTETILLVEDEAIVLELANCTLQQLGYEVLACAGADEALHTLAAHSGPIDLLLTDVVMPRMNGKELAARVAALRPGLAVLFTSGYGEKIIAKEGVLDLGVNFIGKPYRPVELAETVRRVLDRRAEALGLAARPRSEVA
jgi:two-component system, cell cycle sensor histidine kinase and response regulator CckA